MIKGMINMRKKVITLILIAIMVQSVYACGRIMPEEANHDGINEPAQGKEVSEETEDTLSNSEVQQAADEESTDPIYIIEPELTQDDTYEMQDWQAAYVEYIDGLEQKEYYKCSLIYVDDDDIPELVITTNIEADGCYILTFHNGEVDVLRTARLNFYYIEKQNLINNSDGHMGYYYDIVYSIENGKWVCVAVGEWTETYVVEDDALVYRYEWEGEEVKEEVYEAKLDEIFDWKQAKYPEYVKSDEMLLRLQTNDSDEADTIYLKPCNTYQDILDNAYAVIVADRVDDIIPSDEVFSFVGIREALLGRDTDEALAGIGYMFYDVDGNGTEELIIADMLDDDGGPWDNRILLMYSLAGGKPVLVIDGWSRNRYYLLNDGTIYHEGSSGAAYSVFANFRMAEDGISLEVIDYYSSGYYGDSEWGWFHSTTGETTEDESERIEFENEDVPWKMQDDYMARVKKLDLTFFKEKKWTYTLE